MFLFLVLRSDEKVKKYRKTPLFHVEEWSFINLMKMIN